jgi:hypothetical protein
MQSGIRSKVQMKIALILIIVFLFPSLLLAKREHPEKWYQEQWCKAHKGQIEVVLLDGKAHREGHLKMAHEFAQIGPGGVNQQMKMVGHQNIGNQIDIINFATVSQRFQEGFAVLIGQKDILPVITPVHHMVITAGQLDPQRSCHMTLMAYLFYFINSKDLTPSLFTTHQFVE